MGYRGSGSQASALSFLVLGIVSLLAFGGTRCYKGEITYPTQIGGHLKRAADANTLELAREELGVAVQNMERRGMTEGYTSLFWWNVPKQDVGFWYRNIRSALDELNALPADVTPLERTNVLMKLRETLVDQGAEGGTVITAPDGISIFPHNRFYFYIWFWGSVVLIVLAAWLLLHDDN